MGKKKQQQQQKHRSSYRMPKPGKKVDPVLPKSIKGAVLADQPGSAEYADGSGRVIIVGYHGHCPATGSWKTPGLFVMTCPHEVFDYECHCSDCGWVLPYPDEGGRVEFTNWALQELAAPQSGGSL